MGLVTKHFLKTKQIYGIQKKGCLVGIGVETHPFFRHDFFIEIDLNAFVCIVYQ